MLNKKGKPLSAPTSTWRWQVVGAEQINGINQVAYFDADKQKLKVDDFDQNWQFTPKRKVYSATSGAYFDIEKLFDQDFDANGVKGKPPTVYTVIEAAGNVELIKDQYRVLYTESAATGLISSITKRNGRQVLFPSSSNPKWQLLGAETVDGKNMLLWQETASGSVRSWTCDENWNQRSSSKLFAVGTDDFYRLEQLFQQDVDDLSLIHI